MCQKVKVFPQPLPKTKRNKNTSAYYQCLLNASLQGFNQPITQICRNCKANGGDLAQTRNQEISNLLVAYEQIGQSLRTLLTPLEND